VYTDVYTGYQCAPSLGLAVDKYIADTHLLEICELFIDNFVFFIPHADSILMLVSNRLSPALTPVRVLVFNLLTKRVTEK